MKVKLYSYEDLMEERQKTQKDVISYMLHLVCWCLYDEFNFDEEKLKRTISWINTKANDFMSNREVTLTDVHKMLIDECGIDIEFDDTRMS